MCLLLTLLSEISELHTGRKSVAACTRLLRKTFHSDYQNACEQYVRNIHVDKQQRRNVSEPRRVKENPRGRSRFHFASLILFVCWFQNNNKAKRFFSRPGLAHQTLTATHTNSQCEAPSDEKDLEKCDTVRIRNRKRPIGGTDTSPF